MNYGGSRRSGPSTSTSSIARANAYGASSSNPNFAYGCPRPKTPSINYHSYPFSNGTGTASNQRLPPPGSCTGLSGNSRNSPNNRSPYSVYANTSSVLSGGRSGEMKSVVDNRLQSNSMDRSVNNFQPMVSRIGLFDPNATEALRPSSSGPNTFGMGANNFDQNANLINSQAESERNSQWNPGSGFYIPHGQETVKQHISIGNYQALESVRHQQQMQQQPMQQQLMQNQQMQQQTMQQQQMQQQPIMQQQHQAVNHTAPQSTDAHTDGFKTQGSYYVDPNGTSMQSAQNSDGGMNSNRRGRYSSSPNLHYPTGQITNSGMVPHSTTSQMAGAAAENQGQAHDRVHRQKSNTSRMLVMNNPNNVSRSSANFVRPQYENEVGYGIHQAQLHNHQKHSMKNMGAGAGGEGAAINRSQQQLVNSIHGQQFGTMQSQGGEMYGKPDMQQFQSVHGRSSPQAGGEPDDGGTSGEEGGVTYIPMSWGELLGGGKDGLQKMQVVMSPPGSDSPNQNRQLRLAFGDQQVTTQPGEVPLKILSINPIEGYEMGPVAELHADRSGVTEITSPNEAVEIKANAAYGSDPHVLLANSQMSQRPESKPAVASGVSYIPRYSKPLVSNSIPIQTGSSLGYTSYNPVTSTAVRRSGFAGTKFY